MKKVCVIIILFLIGCTSTINQPELEIDYNLMWFCKWGHQPEPTLRIYEDGYFNVYQAGNVLQKIEGYKNTYKLLYSDGVVKVWKDNKVKVIEYRQSDILW